MPEGPLRIETRHGSRDGQLILRLSGPLTLANVFEFQNLVRADESACLFIDLSEVPYIDSAGIGALMGTYVSGERRGRQLVLVGVSERVRQALQVTKVVQYFTMAATQQEAESAVSSTASRVQ
jgi:anti-sigma B factor antagonist